MWDKYPPLFPVYNFECTRAHGAHRRLARSVRFSHRSRKSSRQLSAQIMSPFFESSNNSEKLLGIYGVVDFRGRELAGVVSDPVKHTDLIWLERIALMAKSEPSISTWKALVGSECKRIGVVVKACFSKSNSFCPTVVHSKVVSLQVRAMKGCAINENPLMKR